MNKKYILTDETKKICGHTLHRIKAVKDFGDVKTGDLGGFIEKEENLSHDGNAWVYENASIYGDASIFGNAKICSNDDYVCISGFGSKNRITTFFKCKDNHIRVD